LTGPALLDSASAFFNSAVMRLLAPAKINLHLRVGPRRADGFHPLLSWMTTVGLFDNLTLEAESSGPLVSLECDLPGLPCDARNLVVRIGTAFAAELRSRTGANAVSAEVHGIRAVLQKRIPVGAGLGGGSSDAARMLLGLDRLWRVKLATDELSTFAARFGSDLSFFVYGPSSVCAGRGEDVTPIDRPKPRWAVLVLPDLLMPTADVYRRFDQLGLGREQDVADAPNWREWAGLSSRQLLPRLVNDLERPAFEIAPQLGKLRDRLEALLGRPVRMSGSGSSLFTLFDSETDAREASARIERETSEHAPAVEVSPIVRDDLNEEFAIQ
jgi:4-diphosphocytidyl-2-C-methyl-D-erythritol kinase